MAKRDEAVAMRDAALAVVKARGSIRDASGRRVLMADEGGMSFLLTTPFSGMPVSSAPKTYSQLMVLQDLGRQLPYMIDVWAPREVLSVSWNDAGEVCVTNFKRGAWQEGLARLADEVSGPTGSAVAATADMGESGGGRTRHGQAARDADAPRSRGRFAVLTMGGTIH